MGVLLKKHSKQSIQDSLAKRKPAGVVRRLKDPVMKVHFLQDPEEWGEFEQFWDEATRSAVIITEENADEYRSERKSSRYVANVVNLDGGDQFVIEMPKTLAGRVNRLYAKNGSLLEFDIELSKTGQRTDTEYEADFDGIAKASQYKDHELFDLEEAVNDLIRAGEEYRARQEADVDVESYEEPEETKPRKTLRKKV